MEEDFLKDVGIWYSSFSSDLLRAARSFLSDAVFSISSFLCVNALSLPLYMASFSSSRLLEALMPPMIRTAIGEINIMAKKKIEPSFGE